jgi:hypothetical protein
MRETVEMYMTNSRLQEASSVVSFTHATNPDKLGKILPAPSLQAFLGSQARNKVRLDEAMTRDDWEQPGRVKGSAGNV